MAHFYGYIRGNRGEATRMGSEASGFRAWAQSWQSRIAVSLHHSDTDDTDYATISITGGGSSGYQGRSLGFRPNEVVAALDSNDPKVNRIWARIERDFARLDEEAPKAVKRQERKREITRKTEERERKLLRAERAEIIREADGGMKKRLTQMAGIEWDEEGNPVDWYFIERANLRTVTRTNGGYRIVIDVRRGMRTVMFDIGNGQWVLSFPPEDIGMLDTVHDSGYGWSHDDIEEATV